MHFLKTCCLLLGLQWSTFEKDDDGEIKALKLAAVDARSQGSVKRRVNFNPTFESLLNESRKRCAALTLNAFLQINPGV